jgi:predicted metal-dependent peptidase
MATFTKLDKAKAQLLSKSPFFATLLMGTQLIERKDIPTAATDGKKIYYNAAFLDGMSVDLVQFVLAHELVHMILEHVERRGARNHKLYNIAGDYAGNLLLKDDGFTVWDQALIDEKYRDMSTEQIYHELLKNPPPERESNGMGEDLVEPEGGAEASSANANAIRQRVAQAANVARMAGKMSDSIAKLVDEMLNPKVSWQDLLRDYMTRANKDDESWSRRNRRFGSVYLPARYSERMGEIIIIGDTSGSIGQEELDQVAAEVNAIAEQVRPECIRVIWADTEVAGEQTFEVGEEIRFEPKGGGGTDMRVPLKYVTQYNPEVVILATDGYTPWPDVEPEYPLIVCCSTSADVPVGQVVRLD